MQDASTPTDMEWADRGSCRGRDPSPWFARSLRTAGFAIRICGTCEVEDVCLAYAIDNDINFGVWGGLTERQRRLHRRRLPVHQQAS